MLIISKGFLLFTLKFLKAEKSKKKKISEGRGYINLENLPAGTLGWLKLNTLSSSSISGTTQSSLVDVLPFFLVGDGMSGEKRQIGKFNEECLCPV